MGEIGLNIKTLTALIEVVNSDGGIVALLSVALVASWLFLIKKFTQHLAKVEEDQKKCHKDRDEFKRELNESRRANKELDEINKKSQIRLIESQASMEKSTKMLQDTFEVLISKLDK